MTKDVYRSCVATFVCLRGQRRKVVQPNSLAVCFVSVRAQQLMELLHHLHNHSLREMESAKVDDGPKTLEDDQTALQDRWRVYAGEVHKALRRDTVGETVAGNCYHKEEGGITFMYTYIPLVNDQLSTP